jgi:uroporphyrinogen decarboxylase
MNKLERVQAALHNQPVDHVPTSFWFHFDEEHIAGQAMADTHLTYYRTADPDFLKVMNDTGYELVGIDSIQTTLDWRRLRPAPITSRRYQDVLDGLKRIVDAIGDEAPAIMTIFCPFATANNNMTGVKIEHTGFVPITNHLREDPDSVIEGLAVIAESLATFSRACIDAGAAGIYFSATGNESSRFTAEEFSRLIKPFDQIVLDAAADTKATFNLLHMCGSDLRLEVYTDYKSHAVNWAPQLGNISLPEGRNLFGNRTIIGGLDQRGVIVTGERPEIEAEVRNVLAEMGDKGFMLGAGCTLPPDISIDHLKWAREAAISNKH